MSAKRSILPKSLTEKWNHWEFHAVLELINADGKPIMFAAERKISFDASKPEDFIPIISTNRLEVDLELSFPPRVYRGSIVSGMAWDLVDRLGPFNLVRVRRNLLSDEMIIEVRIIANGDLCQASHVVPRIEIVDLPQEDLDRFFEDASVRVLHELCRHVIDAILDPPTPIERPR